MSEEHTLHSFNIKTDRMPGDLWVWGSWIKSKKMLSVLVEEAKEGLSSNDR